MWIESPSIQHPGLEAFDEACPTAPAQRGPAQRYYYVRSGVGEFERLVLLLIDDLVEASSELPEWLVPDA